MKFVQNTYLHKGILSLLLLIFTCLNLSSQDLEYLAPVLSKSVNHDSTTSFILTANHSKRVYSKVQHKPYNSSVQIVDADQPWPPRWFTATAPYPDETAFKDTAQGYFRFDFIQNVKIVSGYFAFFKLLSRPLMNAAPMDSPELAAYMLLNERMQCVDTVKSKIASRNMNFHDLSIDARGNKLVSLRKDTYLNLQQYSGNKADSAVHCEIDLVAQLNANDSVVLLWDPIKHLDPKLFQFKELLSSRSFVGGNSDIIQWTRLTSAQWDYDGNILYSMKLLGIGKISLADGHVMWQINYNDLPLISGKDTIRWYSQHDFRFLYETDSSAVYSLYSDGIKNCAGHDSVPACGVLFEQNKKTLKLRLLRYQYAKTKFVAYGQGAYDYDNLSGCYLLSYGNLKGVLSPNTEFTDNFEYGKGDSVYGIYLFPQGINCYKAHRLENFKRPPRPVIFESGDDLVATGDMENFTWYELSGPTNTIVEKVGVGIRLKFKRGHTYCVAGKYGMGYSVSVPYLVKKDHHYQMLLLVVCGCILFGFAGMKFLNRNPVNGISRR